MDELVNADAEGFKHLTEQLEKEWLLGLLKDTIGHLRQAKSSANTLSKVNDKIDDLRNETFAKIDYLKNGALRLKEKSRVVSLPPALVSN